MFRKYDPYFSVTNELPVINTPTTTRRLTRREIVQSLLAGMGALATWPQVASAHPIFTHLSDPETLAKADAKAAAANWTPEFLNSHQNQTLVLLSERIVPGSSRAQVNRIIDLLLTVDTAENRRKFTDSLSAIDVESRKRFGHLFKSRSADQQDEILTSLAAGKPSVDQGSGRSIKKRLQQPALTLRDHFENVKAWIVGTYYSSEAGMRELGWTGDVYFVELPTCPHPEGHE
ncbi:MAG TPA: gluconate 2-dehydrogenase subunit 3 family protein [Terriglobales bacterium]|nr:gluconate 2-dehydrogenase subunit 3 family protein [Terriglobales bacterium]